MRITRVLASLLVLTFGFSCASTSSSARSSASSSTPRIDVPDLEARAMLLYLVDHQTFEPLPIQIGLTGGPELRETVAEALGRIPDPHGRSVLESLLSDEAPAVRRAAAFALGELEEAAAIPALFRAAADPDRETGILAIEAAAKLGGDVVEAGVALEPLPEPERWRRLVPYLFRFRQEAKVALAVAALDRKDLEPSERATLHARAAFALSRDPLPAAAEPLRPLLSDSDPWVRSLAARGLGQVGAAEDLSRLRPLLDDAHLGVVIQTLRAGQRLVTEGKRAAPADWAPRIEELLNDSRSGVRLAAIEAAAAWPAQAFANLADRVAEIADSGSGRERGAALLSLANNGDGRTGALVEKAAGAEDADVRARAAEAAGKLGRADLVARLLADPSPEVRAPAAEARLAASGDLATVESLLEDPDEGVRGAVLGWLGDHPIASADRLAVTLGQALGDRSEEAALAAFQAVLARAEAAPEERARLVSDLAKAARTPRYVLRREAVAAWKKLAGEEKRDENAPELGAAQTSQPPEGYREIIQRTWNPKTFEIQTARGAFRIRLGCRHEPLTCLNFAQLASSGYFDGLVFHRVVPDFVIQGGDPRGDGVGGPGWAIRDEIGRLRYERGTVGMALAGPDTGGSQFFVTLSAQPHLDGGYTAFGRVILGDEVLDQIRADDRIEKVIEVP